MNGTTEVPQEYDRRYMFFFVHALRKQISISEFRRTIEYKTRDWLKLMNYHGCRRLIGREA